MKRLILTLLIAASSLVAAEVVAHAPCQQVADFVVSEEMDTVGMLKPTVKSEGKTLTLTFVEPIHPLPEIFRKIGKLPVGTLTGHTIVYRFTSVSRASKVCMVSFKFTSTVPRVAANAEKSEALTATQLKAKFPAVR